MKKILLILFLILVIGGLSPLLITFLGIGLAEGVGCNIDLDNPEACLIMGVDLGPTLLTMVMMGWLAMVGLPIAAIAAVGLGSVGVIHLVTRRRT